MKKSFNQLLLIVFSVLAGFPVFGQQNSLLWEISGNGLEKPSYLFGTIHINDKRVFQFRDSVIIALDNCRTMAGELDLSQQISQDVLTAISMPGDTTLKMLVSRKQYKMVKKQVRKKLGVVYVLVINKIKPVFLATMLETIPEEKKKGKKQEMNMFLDQYLQEYSKKDNKKITGLETMTEQVKALDILSLREQAAMLVELVENGTPESVGEEFEAMVQAYIREDLNYLYKVVVSEEMSQDFMKSLLTDRNIIMADRMEPLMKEQPTFVAVGAAHLPGESGLLELLRKKGYTVRAVR
jgi:uncharacterized protein